jgi:hypothetical protein
VRAVLALVLLSGCIYDEVPNGAPPDARVIPSVIVHGAIEVTQTAFEPPPECPPAPAGPMRFTVVEGDLKTITIEPPAMISDVRIVEGSNPANVSFTLAQDWADGFTPSIGYHFEVFFGGGVAGTGTFTLDDCTVFLDLEGRWGDI